ncbi:MAG TPA: hypothetical protein PL163_15845 [Leptospiraceae bacterium]|nr:hypothetical protein [Leptospiraceae bacterium]HMY68120.1 hypothetical protein [Leptospiraceae bacterium]HNF25134.1 hypothetical protein [Leptospiraceae bacterium]HNI97899.1 hypothetical protein [Leptospiraceae bacterium]HNM06702.1 hypothetical protein [Leptospiraceae bacterium]
MADDSTKPSRFSVKKLSPSGMPYNDKGRFRSPFANPAYGTPCNIKVGFMLKSVSGFSTKEGKFEADFYVSYTSDKPMPGEIKPHFTNGMVQDDDHIERIADEPTFKLWKFHALFYTQADLRAYPFDTQELEIGMEEVDVGIDQINFIADQDHIRLDSDFVMPGWEVSHIESRVLTHYYPDRFEYDDLYYPRFIFRLGIKRFANSALFTVFLPAFVIVLVSLSGIWLSGKEIETRINSSAPMLAAAVLFHYTLSQEIPATAYLTRADKLMLGVYLGLITNLFATWAFFFFDPKYEERIFKLGRWIVPPLNMILYTLGCII